jgi:tropomyosin
MIDLIEDAEILSVKNKVTLLEQDLARTQARFAQVKGNSQGGDSASADELQRRIEQLEADTDQAENRLKETNDKIRNLEVVSEQHERKAVLLENEKNFLKLKYEETKKKYEETKKELEETLKSFEDL